MASIYTTNYNLDKYAGDDRPNLRDQYNAAMDKIDTQLLTNANAAVTAMTAATNATSAADAASSKAETAQAAAETAQAAAETAQAAAETAQTQIDTRAPSMHASTQTTYGAGNAERYGHVKVLDSGTGTASQGVAASPTYVAVATADLDQQLKDYFSLSQISGKQVDGSNRITLAQNAAGTLFKLYGYLRYAEGSTMQLSSVPGMSGVVGIATGLVLNTAPSAAYEVVTGGRNFYNNATIARNYPMGGVSSFAVATTGEIFVSLLDGSAGARTLGSSEVHTQDFPACLYFNGDFGDTN